MRWLASIATVLATGCTEETVVYPLARFENLTIGVYASPSDMSVFLLDDALDPDEDPCPLLADDFSAHVAGVEMTIDDRGGYGGEQEYASDCNPIWLMLDPHPQTAEAVLVLSDFTETISCNLHDELVPYAVWPLEGATWELTPGQDVTVHWSHPHDFGFNDVGVWFGRDSHQRTITRPQPGTDLMTFTVPQLPPGPTTIAFDVYAAQRITCKPATSIYDTIDYYHAVETPVVIR